jgi:hypothetical protein
MWEASGILIGAILSEDSPEFETNLRAFWTLQPRQLIGEHAKPLYIPPPDMFPANVDPEATP